LRKSENVAPPTLIYEDEGLLYQAVRDYLTPTTEEILVEGDNVQEKVRNHVNRFCADMVPRVHLYREAIPLFRARGIEAEIERLLQRRVWLKSGGYLVIDETEALTVVDVNTGRDLGRGSLEETAFATNLETTREIARQLRLRDLGGIIIIDFIDMLSPNNQRIVMEQFKAALSQDRSHPTLFSMTELGLVQLTRKRTRKSLLKGMTRPCPYCHGEGILFSQSTMVTRVLRRLEELLLEDPRDNITLHVHPNLAEEINANWSERLEELSRLYDARVRVVAQPGLHLHEIRETFEE
jgi:ribonuclease G